MKYDQQCYNLFRLTTYLLRIILLKSSVAYLGGGGVLGGHAAMEFQTYIFFHRPRFQKMSGGGVPRTPLELCRHYGLPLTKILATPLQSLAWGFYLCMLSTQWTMFQFHLQFTK